MEAHGLLGYVPTVDYLNYAVPAAMMRTLLSRYQLFDGEWHERVFLVLAGKPFVSWIATTSRSELQSVRDGSEINRASFSVRLNNMLLPLNERLERYVLQRTPKLFALSQRTAREFADLGILDTEVLYPPIDLDAFQVSHAEGPFPSPVCSRCGAS